MATVKVDQVAAYAILKQPDVLRVDQVAAYAVLSTLPTDPFKVEVTQHIIDSINVTHQKGFVAADLTLGVPVAEVKDRFNTKLNVVFKPSSGYRGNMDFAYYRFPAKEIVVNRDLDILKYDKVMTTTDQVVTRFNTTFGTALTPSDFKSAPIPQDGPCTLEASANSMYFQPGTQINVGWMCPSDRDWEFAGLAWPATLAALPAYFAKAAFVAQLNTVLGRTVAAAGVTFANTASLNPGPSSIREIQRDVSYPSADGQSTQSHKVFYNRLDLAGMSAFTFPTTTKVLEDTTIHHILPTIQAITGIPFTIYDVEDLPVVAQDSLTTFTLTLQAKASSPLFKGTYTLTVGRKPALATVFTSLSLGSV